jgi:hypothetical protein
MTGASLLEGQERITHSTCSRVWTDVTGLGSDVTGLGSDVTGLGTVTFQKY